MGLFDDERIDVFSSVQPLISAPDRPIAAVVINSVLEQRTISNGLMEYSLTNMAIKARSAYNYAYNYYTLGIPQIVEGGSSPALHSAVQAAIESELGQPIFVLTASISKLTAVRSVYPWLIANRGFNPADTTVTSYPFTLHPNAVLPVRVKYGIQLPNNNIQITYEYTYTDEAGDGDISYFTATHTEEIPLQPGMYIGELYCISSYQFTPGGTVYYWYYHLMSFTYNDINREYYHYGSQGYMPIVPLRRDKQDLTIDGHENTELYRTSRRLLKKLDLDIDMVSDALINSPYSEQIDHAYVVFAVDIFDENEAVKKYIYHYFRYLAEMATVKEEDALIDPEAQNALKLEIITGRVDRPEILLSEYGLNIGIAFDYITLEFFPGTIGAYEDTIIETEEDYGVKTKYPDGSEIIDPPDYGEGGSGGDDGSGAVTGFYDDSRFIIKHQWASNYYLELNVVGLRYVNEDIYEDDGVVTPLYKAIEDAKQKIIIPVHYGIVSQNMRISERVDMYLRSLQVVMQSIIITELAWYQQGWFRVVVMIVIMIIVLYTGQAWLIKLGQAISIGLAAVLKWLLGKILLYLVVNKIVKLIVEQVGAENALIIGAILAIASYATGNINNGSTLISLGGTAITATHLLNMGLALMNSAGTEYQRLAKEKLKELEIFNEEAEEEWSQLEEMLEELNAKSLIDPLIFTTSNLLPSPPAESPDAFFARTIHEGNIGTRALDMIGNYTENAVSLPKPDYKNVFLPA